ALKKHATIFGSGTSLLRGGKSTASARSQGTQLLQKIGADAGVSGLRRPGFLLVGALPRALPARVSRGFRQPRQGAAERVRGGVPLAGREQRVAEVAEDDRIAGRA